MQELRNCMELLATQNKLLEMQVAQQALSSARPIGALPSKPGTKEVKAMRHTLRSGTTWEDPPMPNVEEVISEEIIVEEEQDSNKEPTSPMEQASGEEPILSSEKTASKESFGSSKAKDGPKVSTEVPR